MAIIYYNSGSGVQSANIDPYSGSLQLGEDYVWSDNIQDGFIFKHTSVVLAITNFRIYMYDVKSNQVTGLLMLSDLDDIVVMNVHTDYNSTRVGNYGRIVKGFGVSYGQTRGTRTQVGDLLFMSKGNAVITWRGISDPNGLKKLVQTIQKELYPKNLMSNYTPTTTQPPTTPSAQSNTSSVSRSVCTKCGTANYPGSSYCCKCGFVLK